MTPLVNKPTKKQDCKFKIIISNESLPYLENSTLDYVTDGINTTFKLLNPNETGSCGCGISVSF